MNIYEGINIDLKEKFGEHNFENPYLNALYESIISSLLSEKARGFLEKIEDISLGLLSSFPQDLNIDYELDKSFFNENIFEHLQMVSEKIANIIEQYIRKNNNIKKTIFINFKLFLIDINKNKIGISFFPSYEKLFQNDQIYDCLKQNILDSNLEDKNNLLKILDKICFFPSPKSYIDIINKFFLEQKNDTSLHNSYMRINFPLEINCSISQVQQVFEIIINSILISLGYTKNNIGELKIKVEKLEKDFEIHITNNIVMQPNRQTSISA